MRLLSLRYSLGVKLLPLILALILMTFGQTPLWSQDSEPRLPSSNETLLTWNSIAERFQTELNGLQTDLSAALIEAEQSRTYSERLTSLYGRSLRRISDLEIFVDQIGERMQARDMDLYWAYLDIEELEDQVSSLEKDKLKMLIVIIVMGAVILGGVAFFLIKLYLKAKVPLRC